MEGEVMCTMWGTFGHLYSEWHAFSHMQDLLENLENLSDFPKLKFVFLLTEVTENWFVVVFKMKDNFVLE